ncbi:MAG: hypothetical protein IJ806_04500 [Ruminococcus sp.]|nr:hypothetical protein [Ruminococcus sp.]
MNEIRRYYDDKKLSQEQKERLSAMLKERFPQYAKEGAAGPVITKSGTGADTDKARVKGGRYLSVLAAAAALVMAAGGALYFKNSAQKPPTAQEGTEQITVDPQQIYLEQAKSIYHAAVETSVAIRLVGDYNGMTIDSETVREVLSSEESEIYNENEFRSDPDLPVDTKPITYSKERYASLLAYNYREDCGQSLEEIEFILTFDKSDPTQPRAVTVYPDKEADIGFTYPNIENTDTDDLTTGEEETEYEDPSGFKTVYSRRNESRETALCIYLGAQAVQWDLSHIWGDLRGAGFSYEGDFSDYRSFITFDEEQGRFVNPPQAFSMDPSYVCTLELLTGALNEAVGDEDALERIRSGRSTVLFTEDGFLYVDSIDLSGEHYVMQSGLTEGVYAAEVGKAYKRVIAKLAADGYEPASYDLDLGPERSETDRVYDELIQQKDIYRAVEKQSYGPESDASGIGSEGMDILMRYEIEQNSEGLYSDDLCYRIVGSGESFTVYAEFFEDNRWTVYTYESDRADDVSQDSSISGVF